MKAIALLLPTLALAGGCSAPDRETPTVGSLEVRQLAALPSPTAADRPDETRGRAASTVPVALVRVVDRSSAVVPVDLDEGPFHYEVVLESTLPAKHQIYDSLAHAMARLAESSFMLREAEGAKVRFLTRSMPMEMPPGIMCVYAAAPVSISGLDGAAAEWPGHLDEGQWRRYRYAFPITTGHRLRSPVTVEVLPTIVTNSDPHTCCARAVPILSRADLPPPIPRASESEDPPQSR